jgi:hypothetical protein
LIKISAPSFYFFLSENEKKFVRPERGHVQRQRQKVDKKILEIFFVLLDLICKVNNLDSEIQLNDQNGFCFDSTVQNLRFDGFFKCNFSSNQPKHLKYPSIT